MDQSPPRDLLTPGQQRLLELMPALDAIRLPEVRDTIPASHYIDPARFDAEIDAIFRKLPVIAGPSALLPAARAYVAIDIVGMPVLLTRARDGTVKAFANVCRHRGMRLCLSGDPVAAGRLVCPYHAWTYDLDGRLVGLPRPETFPGLGKAELGLKRLPCREAGGLIWVGLDADDPPDFATIEGELAADLDAFSMRDLFLFDKATFKVEANWKLLMDSMLDSYHVTRLHKDSLAQFSVDSENMIDRIGPHIRNAAHRGNFDKAAITDRFGAMRKMMVFSYIGFPNGIIVVSPHYISLGVVRPIDHRRTEIDYYQLYDAPPRDERIAGKMREAFALMEQVFAKEDYWAAELCDKGLRSGTLREVQLGGMEVQIRMFQDAVTECLERGASMHDRVVLVTGGASGIGRAAAERLAREGASVMIADRDEKGGRVLAAAIAEAGGVARFTALDVADEEQARAAVAATLAAFGRIDGAINSAGVPQAAKPTHDIDAAEWAFAIGVNLTGMFYCLKHQIAAMLEHGDTGGAIVAISSAAALKGLVNSADYCATKAGIMGLVRAAAVDYAERAIRINALLPGASDTPLARRSSAANPALAGTIRIPMMRMASPEEIAAVAIWLVSPDSSYVTGASICADGGMTIA